MNSYTEVVHRKAFVVEEESLSKVYSLLEERIGETRIYARCADNVTRPFPNLESLFKYENAWDKRILRLAVIAIAPMDAKSATVRYGPVTPLNNASIVIEASEAELLSLRQDLSEIVSGQKAGYYWLSEGTGWRLVLFIGVCSTAIIALGIKLLTLIGLYPRFTSGTTIGDVGLIRILGICVIAYISGHATTKLFFYLFPPTVFLVGQERKRELIREKVRWGVLIALIVGIAGSALWGLLSNLP